MSVKITDLVDQSAIDKLKELDEQLDKVLKTYTSVAQELAKGLNIKVNGVNDLDKLEQLLATKGKEATQVQQQLTTVISQQQQVIANTTNTISRQLMEQERVNKTQREAYTETEKVKNLLAQVNGTYENNIRNLLRVNDAIAANKKQQDDLKKSLDTGRISLQTYQESLVQLTIKERELKQQKATLNTLLKNEERENQAVEGSYNQLSQQLELLKKAYKSMTDEEKASPLGKEIETTIQNLDAHLKDMAADMGEFQRNVGNYAIANNDLKKKYEELIGTLAALQTAYGKMSEAEQASAEGQKLADSIEEVANAAREIKQALNEQTQAVEDAKKSLGETSGTTASVKRDLKDLVLEIANLSIAYQSLTEEEKNSAEGQELASHIQDLTEKAGVLKDAIADTNQAITNAASDTRGFDQLSGSIQLAIDGFGLASGAAAMLGISEEDLAEIQTKLQAAIAASNAMQSIQNTLQKQSAVMQGVALAQTKLRTIAENIHTAAQGKGIVVTKLATVAQWAFNAAASANPIGLLVVAIVACIAVVWGLIAAFKAFIGPTEEANKALEEGTKKIEAMTKANEELISVLEKSGATQASITRTRLQYLQQEIDAMRRLQEEAQGNNADEEKIAELRKQRWEKEEELLDIYQSAYFSMTSVIREQALLDIKDREGDAAYKKKLIDNEIDSQLLLLEELKAVAEARGYSIQQYEDAIDALEQKRQRAYKEINKDATKNAQSLADQVRSAVNDGQKALLALIKNSGQRQLNEEQLKYSQQLENLNIQLYRINQIEGLSGAQRAQMREAILNQIQGLEAEHAYNVEMLLLDAHSRTLQLETEYVQLRLAAVEKGSEQEYALRREQNDLLEQTELQSVEKRVAEGTITYEEGERLKTLINQKYYRIRQDLEDEQASHAAEAVMKQYADEKAIQDAAYVNQLNALKQRYVEQMRLAEGNAEQQAAIQAQFEADQAKLSEDYAIQTAQHNIDMLEAVLKTEGLTDEQRKQYMAELAKAKGDLATAIADKEIAEMQRTSDEDKKATEKRLANIQNIFDKVTEALNNISALSSAVFDAKIQQIEDEQDANQEAADAEAERISDLVEKKVITEEEGEARKRAAEAKTAKKNEELERKKQKLQHAQAVWEKANNIAQIGMATSLGIMQALAMLPPNIPLSIYVGAMGALQLASVIATPIPKYAKGTKSHKGGPAIVGDGGEPELVTFAGKSWITPDSPTIVDLPAGAAVVPHISGVDETLVSIPNASTDGKTPVIVNNDYSRLEAKMDNFIYLLKQQTKQQRQIASDAALRRIADRL